MSTYLFNLTIPLINDSVAHCHIIEDAKSQPERRNCIITRTKRADLRQICFDINRSTAEYFIVCRVCFQSVADVKLEYLSLRLQTKNRLTTDLQMICNALEPKNRYYR